MLYIKKGTIFNIQKFSVNDGPGIRTTVFMKGCPLNCLWCHNPESKKRDREIFYNSSKCIGCGLCRVCPNSCHIFEKAHIYDRSSCTECGKCAEECVSMALEAVGEEKSVDEVLKEVLKDRIFYENSGGGITLSGGEPMYQFDFSYELLKASKENGIHTCMETCGFAASSDFEKIAKYTDIFLFDYKVTDPVKHKEYTGVSNELILKNLRFLDKFGCCIVLRCPIIPGLNDTPDHFDGIARTAESLKNISEINIEPYHPLGGGKNEMLGKEYPAVLKSLSFPDESTVKQWMEYVSSKTDVPVSKA